MAPPRRRFGLSHARVKSDTIPRSTSSCSSSRHRHEFEGERYRRWLSLFFVFPLFSLSFLNRVTVPIFSLTLVITHAHAITLSLSLRVSHSLVQMMYTIRMSFWSSAIPARFIQPNRAGVGNSSI